MALRLRIVSNHRRSLGSGSSVVFGVTGGSIGRAADNDWVLPDPSRYVSSRHARIRFNSGKFFIEDLSTNGTYLNDADEPIRRASAHELHNGDMIRCGEYHIVVALDGAGGTSVSSTERNAMVSLDATLTSSTNQNPAVAGHLNVAFNPNAMFKPEDSGKINGIKPVSAYGQSVLATEPTAAPAVVPKNVEDSDIVAARRMEKLAKAVRERDSQPAAVSATSNEARQGLEAFCRGAGIDAINLNSDNAAGMLQLAGRLLREALISLKDLDTKQTETRSRFRLPPEKNDDTLPFRVGAATDELIAALLSGHDSRRLDPGQWLRQCFERQARHEEAVARGAQYGFAEFLRQLDPKDLERRFASAQKRGVLSKGPNFWQLYAEFYRTACEPQADEAVPALYAESFAQAYAAGLKKN